MVPMESRPIEYQGLAKGPKHSQIMAKDWQVVHNLRKKTVANTVANRRQLPFATLSQTFVHMLLIVAKHRYIAKCRKGEPRFSPTFVTIQIRNVPKHSPLNEIFKEYLTTNVTRLHSHH